MKRFIGVLLLAAVVGGCARNVLNGLISPDEAARQEALQKLDGLSPADRREVLKGLMDRLGNESGNVRRRVIQALVRFGGDAVPPLTGALTSSDRRGRVAAAETLGLLAPSAKGAAATLVGLRDDPDPEMSAWVAVALQRITGAMNPSEKRLFEAVHGQIFFLAPVSMAQAAPSPAPGDLPALVKGLSSSRESVRIAAVLGLLESGIVAAPLLTSS